MAVVLAMTLALVLFFHPVKYTGIFAQFEGVDWPHRNNLLQSSFSQFRTPCRISAINVF